MTEKYTLLIPTYNRPELLGRLLGYLKRAGASFPVLVLDSSTLEMQDRNKGAVAALDLDVRHVFFPDTTEPYAKMRDGLQMVSTPYCSICADDDILIPSAVQRCVGELERDRRAVVAHGCYFNFRETETFNLSYVVYRGKSVEDDRAVARLRTLFAAYEAVLYGIFRTDAARRAFRDVDRMNTVLGKELLTGALSVIAGKALRTAGFYYGRNTAESFSYTAWHPHQILAHEPEVLFAQYSLFRTFLLEGLHEADPGYSDGTDAKIIDLILLRYLEPYLRHDVLDLMLDMSMQGEASAAIVTRIWDKFVRPAKRPHSVEQLLDPSGDFSPNRLGPGKPRDYEWNARNWDGKSRKYLVYYEFLFPEKHPTAVVARKDLVPLLQSLNAY